jgi:hypothetical protein
MRIPNNIRLVDEEFNVSKPIDVLIGAEICILENIMCRPDQSASTGPICQKTVFGWIIRGPSTISDSDSQKNIPCSFLKYMQ